MADGEAEARFAHLLQPIRDLARNWDIDIASSLEDYLEELDQLKISLDGGEANLNFAEAALLIQGTACIYSRKVEYLHSLVFQVLDRLAGSQGQQGGGKGRRGRGGEHGGDGDGKDDDDANLLGGAGDPFPLLDSLLEEGKGEIDLKPQLVLESLKAAAAAHTAGGNKGPAPHCRPPLLVMEECNASFKVATCAVHKSGALLMEESLRRELEPALAAEKGKRRPSYGMVYGEQGQGQAAGQEQAGGGGDDDDAMGAADAAWGAGGDDYGGGGMDDDFRMDDDDGYGPPPEETAGEGEGAAAAAPEGMQEGGEGAPAVEQQQQQRELRSRHQQQQAPEEEGEDEDDEDEEDPWAALDPHDPGKAQPRPFRKGKAPKAPPMPKGQASTSSAPAPTAAAAALLSLTGLTFAEFAPLAKALEAQAKKRVRARRALVAPGAVAAGAKDDRRASGRRRSMALYAAITAPAPLAEGRVAEAAAAAAAAGAMGAAGGDADDLEEDDDDDMIGAADAAWGVGGDGDDYGGGGMDDDFRMDDDDGYGPQQYEDGEGAAAAAIGGALEEGGGMGGGRRRQSYAPVSLEDGGLLDDAFAGAAQSYEALCRKHMDAFMRGLEAYAHETQLTRRVADWQDKVEPMLEVQERRTPFDIHDCGDEILSSLAKEEAEAAAAAAASAAAAKENGGDAANAAAEEEEGGKKGKKGKQQGPGAKAGAEAEEHKERSFQEIVSGKEQYEVCRLFLASLQLANNGNVQLVHEAGPQDKDGLSFKLNLLDDRRMHERFTGAELGDIGETAH